MKPAILYQATNLVTGHRYIGITSAKICQRRGGHFADMRAGSRTKFHNALRKYGRAAFEWRPLAVLCSLEDAAETEIRAIATLKPEYNSHAGGSLGAAGLPIAIRMSMNAAKRKPVRCITTGEVFESCTDAEKKFGLHLNAVAEVCRGRNIHAAGLRFVFEDDYQKGNFDPNRKKKPDAKRKRVVCLDTGVPYASLCDAAKEHQTTAANVRMVCQGKRRIAGGVRFQYEGVPVVRAPATVRAKLTAGDVLKIRALIPTHTFKQLAKMFGVSHRTISDIKRRRSWKGLH